MQTNPKNLPEDILIEIFSRLPAKAVGRFRCLSKTWCTQLSTPQFVKLHLSRRKNHQNILLNGQQDNSLHIIDNTVSRKLELGVQWKSVLGSCNGLVLLSSNTVLELFLVNPITHQHFQLPHISLFIKGIRFTYDRYGLGYDSLTDDYKVVVYTYYCDRSIFVYSVKSGAWKRVDAPPDYHFSAMLFGAFVNGAVHGYSVIDSAHVIEAFDLASGVFHKIPGPPTKTPASFDYLLVLQGCLCLSSVLDNGDIETWVMKEYGLADSWKKFTIVMNWERDRFIPLCFIGDSEIVVVSLVTAYYDNKLVVYNFKEGTEQQVLVDRVSASYFDGGVAFVDSLVSPNHQYSN